MKSGVYKFYGKEDLRAISWTAHHERAIIGNIVKNVNKRAVSEYIEYKTRVFARSLYPLGIVRLLNSFFKGGDQR